MHCLLPAATIIMFFWTGEFLQVDYDPDGNHFLGTMEQFFDPNNAYSRSIVVASFPDSTVKVPSQIFYYTWYQNYVDIKESIAIINNEKTDDMSFPEWVTSHIKKPSTQFLGNPVFDTYLGLLKITMTLFRLDVPNLEVLKIGDIPGMSPNSIMPIHNDVSKLVH